MAVPLSAQQGRGRGRIHGKVQDTKGNPVEGAKITAVHARFKITFEGKSDKNGSWAIAGLGTGLFRLTATKEGYEPVNYDMKVSQFSRNNPPVTLTLEKKGVPEASIPGLKNKESLALFEEGNTLFQAKKYEQAAAKYKEFLSLNPAIYQVYINLGNCYRELGQFDEAVAAYEKILAHVKEEKGSYAENESAARAMTAMGETLIKKGDLAEASKYLKQAMEIFPQDETLAFNIGEIYFNQNETDKAIEYYKQSIQAKEDWPPPYRRLGYAYLNKGAYDLALENFQKFLDLAPEDPRAPTIKSLIPQIEKLIKKEDIPVFYGPI